MSVIAITGGTGFIGSHLAKELVARGHFATLIARGSRRGEDSPRRESTSCALIEADLNNETALFEAFSKADIVCHLTGINRERSPGDFDRIHVDGTARVAAAAGKANVKKIVFVSFLRARPSRTSKYLDTKWKGEELIRNCGLDYTIVKPGMVYGSGDQMISSIVHGLTMTPFVGLWPSVGLLEKAVNPIYIDDFIRILIAALLENRLSRQTVSVAGPNHITLSKAVDRVARVMKKPMITIPMPILGQYLMAFAMERMSNDPLVCVSQVRMLSEGMCEPLPESDLLPSDLVPKTYFSEESIRKSFQFPRITSEKRTQIV